MISSHSELLNVWCAQPDQVRRGLSSQGCVVSCQCSQVELITSYLHIHMMLLSESQCRVEELGSFRRLWFAFRRQTGATPLVDQMRSAELTMWSECGSGLALRRFRRCEALLLMPCMSAFQPANRRIGFLELTINRSCMSCSSCLLCRCTWDLHVLWIRCL